MSYTELALFSCIFAIASTAPLGPSGHSIVFNFSKFGAKAGLLSLTGVLVADLVFSAVALFLNSIGVIQIEAKYEFILITFFALFLIYFGIRTLQTKNEHRNNLYKNCRKIFLISICNPGLIISYLTFITMLQKLSTVSLDIQTLAFFLGIFLVFSVLTLIGFGLLSIRKSNFINTNQLKINQCFGTLFILSGVFTFFTKI